MQWVTWAAFGLAVLAVGLRVVDFLTRRPVEEDPEVEPEGEFFVALKAAALVRRVQLLDYRIGQRWWWLLNESLDEFVELPMVGNQGLISQPIDVVVRLNPGHYRLGGGLRWRVRFTVGSEGDVAIRGDGGGAEIWAVGTTSTPPPL